MLPPHIAECTRPHMAITPLSSLSRERWWRWKMYKLLPRRTAFCVVWLSGARCVVGSLVFPRVGTRASFDAEQKTRRQTHRRSHSARIPNIRRARARTLSSHPNSRLRGKCSAMCGGSMRVCTSGVLFYFYTLLYRSQLRNLHISDTFVRNPRWRR
jgi:hypothetical protein